jgi:xylulokinase
MILNCFKNGGLARARLRDRYGLDWKGFAAAMASVPPGNHGRLLLPWFDTEIVPRVLQPGVRRLNLSEDDAAGNCRALVEAQMMTMRLHAAWMNIRPRLIHATEGGSEDPAVLRVMADIFQCPVQRSEQTNSVALGAALIAAHATAGTESWMDTARGFVDPTKSNRITPDPEAASIYQDLMLRYAEAERAVLRGGTEPR